MSAQLSRRPTPQATPAAPAPAFRGASTDVAGDSPSGSPGDASRARLSGGGETVLLVEDEYAVRTIARAALTRRGYRVLAAADASEALAITRAYPGPIALLLTGVVMPGMGGRELAERVVEERPGVRVLFTSGYTEDEVLHRGVSAEAMAFLRR